MGLVKIKFSYLLIDAGRTTLKKGREGGQCWVNTEGEQ